MEDLAAFLKGEGIFIFIVQLLIRIITQLFVFQIVVPLTPPWVIFIGHMVLEQIEVVVVVVVVVVVMVVVIVVVEEELVMEVETSM